MNKKTRDFFAFIGELFSQTSQMLPFWGFHLKKGGRFKHSHLLRPVQVHGTNALIFHHSWIKETCFLFFIAPAW